MTTRIPEPPLFFAEAMRQVERAAGAGIREELTRAHRVDSRAGSVGLVAMESALALWRSASGLPPSGPFDRNQRTEPWFHGRGSTAQERQNDLNSRVLMPHSAIAQTLMDIQAKPPKAPWPMTIHQFAEMVEDRLYGTDPKGLKRLGAVCAARRAREGTGLQPPSGARVRPGSPAAVSPAAPSDASAPSEWLGAPATPQYRPGFVSAAEFISGRATAPAADRPPAPARASLPVEPDASLRAPSASEVSPAGESAALPSAPIAPEDVPAAEEPKSAPRRSPHLPIDATGLVLELPADAVPPWESKWWNWKPSGRFRTTLAFEEGLETLFPGPANESRRRGFSGHFVTIRETPGLLVSDGLLGWIADVAEARGIKLAVQEPNWDARSREPRPEGFEDAACRLWDKIARGESIPSSWRTGVIAIQDCLDEILRERAAAQAAPAANVTPAAPTAPVARSAAAPAPESPAAAEATGGPAAAPARRLTPDERTTLVMPYLSGKATQAEIAARAGVTPQAVSKWPEFKTARAVVRESRATRRDPSMRAGARHNGRSMVRRDGD